MCNIWHQQIPCTGPVELWGLCRCERPTALRYVVPLPCGYITMRCERVRELRKCRDDDINVWFWPQKSGTNASQFLMEDLLKRCYRTISGALIIELRSDLYEQQQYQCSINAVSKLCCSAAALQLPCFASGHFPLSATLFRGPGVHYDTDTITFSSCAHDAICSDLKFVNKAGRRYPWKGLNFQQSWTISTALFFARLVFFASFWYIVLTLLGYGCLSGLWEQLSEKVQALLCVLVEDRRGCQDLDTRLVFVNVVFILPASITSGRFLNLQGWMSCKVT